MNDCRDKLELKYGRRDLLETLDEARERIVSGDVEAIMLLELPSDPDKGFFRTFSWKDDMPLRWTRFVAAMASIQHGLLADGLEAE